MLPLEGKSILVLCQKLYNYDQIIVKELEAQGAEVFFFENKFFREDPVLYKDIYGFLRRMVNPGYKDNYLTGVLNNLPDKEIDYILCVGGFSVTETFLAKLTERNPKIESILYLWDSVAIWNYSDLFTIFDRVYTFDRQDATKYSLRYLPLFFNKTLISSLSMSEREIDLIYVASIGVKTRARLKFASKIKKYCQKNGLNSFIHLFYSFPQSSGLINTLKWISNIGNSAYQEFRKLLKEGDAELLKNIALSAEVYQDNLSKSKCVIDIPVPGQVGMTIRTIESLAAGCKLITTNSAVQLEPFYDPNWIMVVDQNNPVIEIEFVLRQPAKNLNMEAYQLGNWLVKLIIDE